LKGRQALVTGGCEGIGLAIVRALTSLGAYVVVNHPPSTRWDTVTPVDLPAECCTVEADVGDAKAITGMFERVADASGCLDILVNNAGVFPRTPFMELDESQWDDVLAVNLKGAFLCAQEATRLLKGSECARIINIASTAFMTGSPRGVHYAASKGGMVAMTRSLARALAPDITVNAVAPGMTRTRQPERDARAFEEAGSQIPLGRIAEPNDIADVVAFLAGAGSRYITGQTIVVDGGAVLTS
jgi:NAD(P)-dependent dehydrogenase (short-subunit alcohol dehydrogenase family)